MNEVTLAIDGNKIDLGDAVIATSYQLGDVLDLVTRRANYSNRFKVPLTPSNIRSLGFAHLEKSSSSIPYSKPSAQLSSKGIELMPGAKAYVESADQGFNIELFSGAKQFFESLGDKTLEDLTPDSADDYYTGHDGAFINAYFATFGMNEAATPSLLDDRKFTMNYKSIVERIIASAGYTKSGNVFSEARLAKTSVWPLGDKGNYNSTLTNKLKVDAYHVGGVVNLTNVYQTIPFANIISNPSGYWNGSKYTTPDPTGGSLAADWFNYKVRVDMYATSEAPAGGATAIETRLLYNGVPTAVGTRALGFAPWYGVSNMGNYGGGQGKGWEFQMRVDAGTCNLTLTSASRITIESVSFPTVSYKNAQGYMPVNVKQKDFMKDFSVRYGILWRERNNVLIAKTYKEILQDKVSARDWSAKRVGQTNAIKYDLAGKYAQKNNFKYQTEDEGVSDSVGIGSLLVPNSNLEPVNDYYTSMFTNTRTRFFGNATGGYIFCADVLNDVPNESELRIFTIRDKNSIEPTLSGGIATYNVAYFEDINLSYDTTYRVVIRDFYNELANSLAKAKILDRKYMLNVLDINLLDQLTLIFDTDSYYLVNKVSNYLSGKPTAVQLLKIA